MINIINIESIINSLGCLNMTGTELISSYMTTHLTDCTLTNTTNFPSKQDAFIMSIRSDDIIITSSESPPFNYSIKYDTCKFTESITKVIQSIV